MCRLAAYAGPPVPLSCLLFTGPHSLEHQAYQPRELQGSATVNVDGTGVAWWPEPDSQPVRYATEKTPWADPNIRPVAGATSAPMQIAAVRSATPGLGFGPENVSPFTSGRLAGVHNGAVGGFRGPVGRQLVGHLSDASFGELDAVNDSKVLFLLAADRYRQSGDLIDAVTTTIEFVADVVAEAGETATLNLMVGDGKAFAASRASVGRTPDSLYWIQEQDHLLAASEPFDDRATWHRVPDQHVLHFTADHVNTLPMRGNT